MDSFTPTLLSNETIYSWVARWSILSGYPSHRSSAHVLLGSDSLQLTSAFPSFIPRTHRYACRTFDELINDHTILPFYRAFLREEAYGKASFSLISGQTKSLHSKLSLIANRVPTSEPLRYCPICSQADYNARGHTYWRVCHQLPMMTMCLKHSVHLNWVQISRREIALPKIDIDNIVCSNNIKIRELQLSRLVTNAFDYSGSTLNSESLRECYIHKLQLIGLATANGSIRMDQLRKKLRFYWQDIHVATTSNLLTSIFLKNDNTAYPASLFYQQNCQHHPLKHLLLIGFLFEHWEGFINAYSQVIQLQSLPSPRVTKTLLPVNNNEKDIIALLTTGSSMRITAETIHRSVGYVKKIAYLNDIETSSRAKKLFETEKRLVVELATKGEPATSIAKLLKCSAGAIEQIISQIPGLVHERKIIRFERNRDKCRKVILNLVGAHSRRTDIQSAARGQYTWLYKHDREWLYSVLPNAVSRKHRYKNNH